jgi:hypothetical protein
MARRLTKQNHSPMTTIRLRRSLRSHSAPVGLPRCLRERLGVVTGSVAIREDA